jgi:hypothetical protein
VALVNRFVSDMAGSWVLDIVAPQMRETSRRSRPDMSDRSSGNLIG